MHLKVGLSKRNFLKRTKKQNKGQVTNNGKAQDAIDTHCLTKAYNYVLQDKETRFLLANNQRTSQL